MRVNNANYWRWSIQYGVQCVLSFPKQCRYSGIYPALASRKYSNVMGVINGGV